MARSGSAAQPPAFTPHRRRSERGGGNQQNHHYHNQQPLRPETSHGRPPPRGGGPDYPRDDPPTPSLRGSSSNNNNNSPRPGSATPRVFTDLSKKLVAGRKERDRRAELGSRDGADPLAVARQNQGPRGGGGGGGRGGGEWFDHDRRPRNRPGRGGLLDDRRARVHSSGGLPPVDLTRRPTHPPAAKQPAWSAATPRGREYQHEPRAPSKGLDLEEEEEDDNDDVEDIDDDEEVEVVEDGYQSTSAQNRNGRWAFAVPQQQRRQPKQFGGPLKTAASHPRRWSDDRGKASSLEAACGGTSPRQAAESQVAGSTKDSAISLNSDTEEDEESPNKKQRSEFKHQPQLQQPSLGGATTAAEPPGRKSRWGVGSGSGAVPPRPTDPRLRTTKHMADPATTNILEVVLMPKAPRPAEVFPPPPPPNASPPDPFETPRAEDRGVDGDSGNTSSASDDRKTAGGKSSGADTLKSLPSSGRDSSSRKSAPDCDEGTSTTAGQRASSPPPVETRLAKKRERGGDMSQRIPRKHRYNFEKELTSDSGSDDSSEQVEKVMKLANEDPPLGLSFPVSRCSGPSLRLSASGDEAWHGDSPRNVARQLESPNPIPSTINQFYLTASSSARGIMTQLSLTKRNSKKPGSSGGRPIIPGQTLTSRSKIASKAPESVRVTTRSASREVGFSGQSFATTGRLTRSRSRSKAPEMIDLLNDDDDDESEEAGTKSGDVNSRHTGDLNRFSSKLEMEVLKLAIGKAVYSSSCSITFDTGADTYELAFVKAPKKVRETRSSYFSFFSDVDASITRRVFHQDDVLEVKFHAVDSSKQDVAILCDDDESTDDSQQQISFLSMRIKISDKCDLRFEKKDLAPDSAQDILKFVVIEFRNDSDLKDCIRHLRRSDILSAMLQDAELDEADCSNYSKALLEHYKTEAKSRRSALASPVSKHRGDDFVRSRSDEDILLVYPFHGDAAEIEKSAEGLTEARGRDVPDLKTDADDSAKFSGRGHYMTIRVADYERLEPGEYLNDTLIDFWMQWFARRADRSKIHIFSSHFYSTLKKDSPEDIAKWTKNKGINVFEKQLIFIPVNQTLHWSLCVIVNPGAIANCHKLGGPDESDLWPGIFFFDSLKAHRMSQVTKDVRKWLNSECKRLYDSDQSTLPAEMASLLTEDTMDYETDWQSFPFSAKAMKGNSPKVPYQNNGSDCGVFVCRYAYAMYELSRRTPITYAFSRNQNQLTESHEFDFDMSDIARIREEMKTLIRRLTKVYAPWKEAELQREKEEEAELKAAQRYEATKPNGGSDPGSPHGQSGGLENPTPKQPCSDLARVSSNGVNINSLLSPGGVPSVIQENHDRESAESSKVAVGTSVPNDLSACKCTSSSPYTVPSESHDCHDQTDEASKAACGTRSPRALRRNTLSTPSGVLSDVQEGVSSELSSLSSTRTSDVFDLSNRPCLRHPGDPGLAASPAMRSIDTAVPCRSPLPVAAIQDAVSGDSGSADRTAVLKDVENQTTRSIEQPKAQPSFQCSTEENLNAATSPTAALNALQSSSGNSDCIHSSPNGPRDEADHRVGGCTSLHISSSSSSECTVEREEDRGQDQSPDCDCEMDAATVGVDEVEAADDLFPSSSAFEPMGKIDSVQRGVALLTTNDDSTMDTS